MKIYKKRCLNCGREFECKNSRGKYCSDKCRVTQNRKGVTEIVTEKQESLLKNLEEKDLKTLEKEEYWIPNWKRAGFKTKKEALANLVNIVQLVPGYYQFLGHKINTQK